MGKIAKTGLGLILGGGLTVVGSLVYEQSSTLPLERAYNEALDRASDVSRGPYSREVNEGEYLGRIYNEPGFLDERMRELIRYKNGELKDEEENNRLSSLEEDYKKSRVGFIGTMVTGFTMFLSGCIIGFAGAGSDWDDL